MQIHQNGTGPAIGFHANSANLASRISGSSRREGSEPGNGDVEIRGVSSNQLAALAGHLKAVPDTRTDLVSQVRERIEEGHYLTREAAERTAASLRGT